MKNALLVCALGAFAALAAVPAHADTTYTLEFSGCFGVSSHGTCYGTSFSSDNVSFAVAGTPTAPSGGFLPNVYAIDSVSGGMTIGTHSYSIGNTPASGLGGDDLLDLYANGVYDFDPAGIDFVLSSTDGGSYDEFRIFGPIPGAEGQYSISFDECTHKNGQKVCTPETSEVQDFTFSINGQIVEVPPTPAATPEPGSLALLGTSILGGAGLLRRRFRA